MFGGINLMLINLSPILPALFGILLVDPRYL
jgi:hypothetical protein